MERIQVEGRRWRSPVVEWFADDEGVRLRIDDERSPELWMSVGIPAAILRAMLDKVNAETAKMEGGAQ